MANEELIYLLKQMTEDKNPNAADDTASSGLIHRPQSSNNAQND